MLNTYFPKVNIPDCSVGQTRLSVGFYVAPREARDRYDAPQRPADHAGLRHALRGDPVETCASSYWRYRRVAADLASGKAAPLEAHQTL